MWLLEASVKKRLEQAQKVGVAPTQYQQDDFEARHGANARDGGSLILFTAGNTAKIEIKGVLTNTPDFLAMIFGGGNTTYPEIINALAEAESDPAIEDIELAIDSPGGMIEGLFETVAAIQNVSKPTKAIVSNLAASAAYALATQADSIVALNRMAQFGSVGIVANFFVSEDEITITSSEAPNKAPDVTTDKGKEIVRERLDAIHDIFVEAIAEGRATTTKKVNAEFGRGGVLLASEALDRGMIDAIAEPAFKLVDSPKTTDAIKGGGEPEDYRMNLRDLQAQHPDLYAEVEAIGANQENKRVRGHLIMGEQCGDMSIAIKAINEGAEMDAIVTAEYMSAGMNRSDINARQDDDDDATAGDAPTTDEPDADAMAEAVTTIVEANLGVLVEAK